ncbi:MAG: nuclear transport factor 2 family protein [Ignavibacteriaceae bacterium]|nr:nuclear transport factor 2 family protein [Ignavibacteriaceae bacterium]
MKKLAILFLITVIFTGCIKQNTPATTEKVKPEDKAVLTLMSDLLVSLATGDPELQKKVWHQSPSLLVAGIYENAEFFGWDEFDKHLKSASERLKNVNFDVSCREWRISESNRTAWFLLIVNQEYELDGKSFKIENMRYTGVAEKIGGNWKITMFHGSVPVKVAS